MKFGDAARLVWFVVGATVRRELCEGKFECFCLSIFWVGDTNRWKLVRSVLIRLAPKLKSLPHNENEMAPNRWPLDGFCVMNGAIAPLLARKG